MIRAMIFCLTCLSLLLVTNPAIAQEEQDPFAVKPAAKPDPQDPFASDDPFKSDQERDRRLSQEESEERARIIAEMDLQHQLKQLLQEKMELMTQLDSVEQFAKHEAYRYEGEKQQFEVAMAEISHELRTLRERTAPAAPLHNDLVRRLVNSSDSAQQKIGLTYLTELREAVTADEFVPVQLDQTSRQTIVKLLDSNDDSLRRLAGKVVANYLPDAIQLGFQPANGYWEPEPNFSERTAGIRDALNRPAKVDYYETRLDDILAELRSDYRIEIVTDGSIDLGQLMTMTIQNDRLAVALSKLLSQQELAFRVMNDHLAILPGDHPNVTTSLTYNVRGLLDADTDLPRMQSLLESRFEGQATELKFEPLSPYQLVAIGPESLQIQVSEFLGSLNRGN